MFSKKFVFSCLYYIYICVYVVSPIGLDIILNIVVAHISTEIIYRIIIINILTYKFDISMI